MNIRELDNRLCIATPAKLNLFLEIRAKRDDGFHDLETIMSKLSVFDYLTFAPAADGKLDLQVTTAPNIEPGAVPSDASNLVMKTLRLICDLAGKAHGASVKLFKNIPVQAGLGGASGNAAGAILAANRLWKLDWPKTRLLEVASQIGSDVAFFLSDGLARCTGRGEKVQNLNYPCVLPVVIAKPKSGLSTAEIYSRCAVPTEPITTESILAGLQSGQASRIGGALFNRLEQFACQGESKVGDQLDSPIARMTEEFERTHCAGHQLTGSGSCYFGIYHNRRSMLSAARILTNRLPDMYVFTGQTLSSRNHYLKI